MSKNKGNNKALKKHRKLHSITLPCPICKEFRPEEPASLQVKMGNYVMTNYNVRWDGASFYIDKSEEVDRKQKIYYELHCTGKCAIVQSFVSEEELPSILKHLSEDLEEYLVRVPTPPGVSPTVSVSGKKKFIFKLAKRAMEEEDENCVPTA